ncbi:hypothetical protein [Hymenobacter properus]|uniref:Uncharacterized protein n=1 Tax=Hymenobacter properus TaxID=2791026 RepID=A0A931BGV3_9BACT|nr:hypothetical protein [Hymenobacter properus]MBF9143679.1 hypothetical protein [Hymenobacter properus]MBR7722492.1 hypothetical protein [Microvirga sp. SRT04]
MTKVLFHLAVAIIGLAAGAGYAQAQTNAFGQKKNTYNFNKSAADVPDKLPEAVPGRIHLLDGSTLEVPIAYIDYNKIVAVGLTDKTAYTPLDVSSFVMKQDSFVVLKDFKVVVGEDEQEYRIAFVRVGAVGAGLGLYHLKGTMRRDDAVHQGSYATFNGASWGSAGGSYKSNVTEYEMTQAWVLKRDDSPQWVSLPKSGGRLRAIVEPLIADDARLSQEVKWGSLTTEKLPKVLNEYIADKKGARN